MSVLENSYSSVKTLLGKPFLPSPPPWICALSAFEATNEAVSKGWRPLGRADGRPPPLQPLGPGLCPHPVSCLAHPLIEAPRSSLAADGPQDPLLSWEARAQLLPPRGVGPPHRGLSRGGTRGSPPHMGQRREAVCRGAGSERGQQQGGAGAPGGRATERYLVGGGGGATPRSPVPPPLPPLEMRSRGQPAGP